MGLFDFIKKKEEKTPTKNIVACASGTLVDITMVEDPTFAEKMMGDGYAIAPSEGTVVSPIDGEIAVAFPTGHAFGIKSEDGLEVLIHIGIDTVGLNGKGFTAKVQTGQKVHAGDVLVKVDLNAIQTAGLDSTIMNIFTAGFDSTTADLPYGSSLKAGDTVIARD